MLPGSIRKSMPKSSKKRRRTHFIRESLLLPAKTASMDFVFFAAASAARKPLPRGDSSPAALKYSKGTLMCLTTAACSELKPEYAPSAMGAGALARNVEFRKIWTKNDTIARKRRCEKAGCRLHSAKEKALCLVKQSKNSCFVMSPILAKCLLP